MSLCTCKACGCYFANLETAACPGCYQAALSYAGELAGLLSCAVLYVGCVSDPQNPAVQRLREDIRAALAKNPKPSGDGHGSVTTTGAPAPEGAGYAHETRKKSDYSRAYWGQPGDPYPWIVREPSGQCWGPFDTNEAAGKWADDNKIDTCDFEDVMPPPELRHQSGKKPQAANIMALVRKLPNLHGEDFFATRDAIQAALEQLDEECVHQVNQEDARDAARYRWLRSQCVKGMSLHMDGTCRFMFVSSLLPRAQTLDSSIDAVMADSGDSRHVAGKKS